MHFLSFGQCLSTAIGKDHLVITRKKIVRFVARRYINHLSQLSLHKIEHLKYVE